MFIVPCPCAGTGTARPNARKSTSTIRLEVSTLPAATAAGGSALTRQPSGARTVTGASAPAEAGTSGSVRQRTTKQAGRARDRERAIEIAVVLRGRAGEVELELVAGDRDGDTQLELAVGRLEQLGRLVAPVRQRGDPGADTRSEYATSSSIAAVTASRP